MTRRKDQPMIRPNWVTRTTQERFDEKWMPEPFSGCWLWTGALSGNGYGRLSFELHPVHAHRISWMLKHGVMPPLGIDVCHKCDVRMCVNPDHLFLGTRKDNVMDCINKGRRTYKPFGADWSKIRTLRKPLLQKICNHGHLLEGINLYISPKGNPSCTECRRVSGRKNYAEAPA